MKKKLKVADRVREVKFGPFGKKTIGVVTVAKESPFELYNVKFLNDKEVYEYHKRELVLVKRPKRILTVKVDWDLDGGDCNSAGVPRNITIEQGALEELLENAKDNETAVADLLSDEWGFCVYGATLVKSKTKGLLKEEIDLLFTRR